MPRYGFPLLERKVITAIMSRLDREVFEKLVYMDVPNIDDKESYHYRSYDKAE